jgi:gamma-glutamyl-gamma-aminobutyrate hydrolase PuuD
MPLVAVTIGVERKAEPYVAALRAAGLDAEVVLCANAPANLNRYAGLVLAGGSDVDPVWYGEAPNGSGETEPARDAMEVRLLEEARGRDLPVLAICRGLQLMNVAYGGTLHQHIGAHTRAKGQPPLRHRVAIREDSLLYHAVGSLYYEIVSRHHQAVNALGAGLTVSARAVDGTVEGVEDAARRFVLGVQWHPEDNQECAEDRRLFEAFAEAVAGANG